MRSLPQCGACGLYEWCTSPKMTPRGDGRRRVLVVTDCPSEEEDATGLPFTGAAGTYTARILRGLGVDPVKDCWLTHAVICRPNKRGPTGPEVGFCRPNIMSTIQDLAPDVIIPLGHAAISSVIGAVWKEEVGPVARWAGWRIPSQDLNAWVCPTWDPAAVMRDKDDVTKRQFRNHLKAAVALEGKPWPKGVPKWAADVKRVLDPARAASWLRKAAKRETGAVAFDYETNMLKADGDEARIVSCSVAWGRGEPENCIAYPWHGPAIEATGELLRCPIPKIASNLKFEDRWTRHAFGHRVRGWAWDTMLAAHVADNRQAITSVKFQGFVRCGAPVWNDRIEPFLKTRGDSNVNAILHDIDINDLLLYNGLDSIIEFRVAVDQIRELGYPVPWRM